MRGSTKGRRGPRRSSTIFTTMIRLRSRVIIISTRRGKLLWLNSVAVGMPLTDQFGLITPLVCVSVHKMTALQKSVRRVPRKLMS